MPTLDTAAHSAANIVVIAVVGSSFFGVVVEAVVAAVVVAVLYWWAPSFLTTLFCYVGWTSAVVVAFDLGGVSDVREKGGASSTIVYSSRVVSISVGISAFLSQSCSACMTFISFFLSPYPLSYGFSVDLKTPFIVITVNLFCILM